MSVASALADAAVATPHLAAAAVRYAMERAGLAQATGVVLFLSTHFCRHPQPAFVAAASASRCLQVLGMTVPGLCTEDGWILDRPAAAALVLGPPFGLAGGGAAGEPRLVLAGTTLLPPAGRDGPPRFGLLNGDSPIFLAGRPSSSGLGEACLTGARFHLAVSAGLHRLASAHAVGAVRGHELLSVDGVSALDSLLRDLPPELRAQPAPPLHLLAAVREDDERQAIPLLAAHADGSLTLAERLRAGERIAWTLRQPLTAENDMRESLARLAGDCPAPAFAMMFSCIGRGPFFYGGDDHDLILCRERWPGVPLIGAYGSGQIFPLAGHNRQLHNSVVTALCEAEHV